MKTKKKIKFLPFLMILIFISSSICINAKGYGNEYYSDYKLQGSKGLANRTYYIDTSAKNAGYEDEIVNAVNAWINATKNNPSTSKVGLTKVNSASSATIVIKAQASFPSKVSGSFGYASYYSGSSLLNNPGYPTKSNWTNGVVFVKTGLSSKTAQRTICHEIGHLLGLDHPTANSSGKSDIVSIMWADDAPVGAANKANSPTQSDCDMLRYRY